MTWTVADGTRGRRWRAMLVDDGQVVGVLLLETAVNGLVGKLELATAAGLLTLHPEAETLHGNVVRAAGITHVTLPWSDDQILIVAGTPATGAAAARVLAPRVGVGEGHRVHGVSVDVGLTVEPTTFRVLRPEARRWRFVPANGGMETAIELDRDGLPILAEQVEWPLEADSPG